MSTHGDFGALLLPFEQLLKVRTLERERIIDGYAEPVGAYREFYGVIAPAKFFRFYATGWHEEARTWLYFRTDQDFSELKVNDIVIDQKGQSWRIEREQDYSYFNNAKIFHITMVT